MPLYRAKAATDAVKGGADHDPESASRDKDVVDRVCKLMARALHPNTGTVESAAALRLAQGMMAKHHLGEAKVMRQVGDHLSVKATDLHGIKLCSPLSHALLCPTHRCQVDAQRKGEAADLHGGMCTVTLTLLDLKKWKRPKGSLSTCMVGAQEGATRNVRPRWAAAVKVNYAESDSGGGGSSGSDSSEEETEHASTSKSESRWKVIAIERYIWDFFHAMDKFCRVKSYTNQSTKCIEITFYRVLAQTQIAAYQLEVAINTATDLPMDQPPLPSTSPEHLRNVLPHQLT